MARSKTRWRANVQRLERENELNAMQALLETLTRRERQVLDLVVQGKMNKQIAFELAATAWLI